MRRNSKQKHQNKTKHISEEICNNNNKKETGVEFFFFLTLRGCYVKLHDYQLKKVS